MIRAGPHQRQAQGHVDALLHAQVLHRNQPLVVGHRHDRIELADVPRRRVARAHEHRVRRERSVGIDAQRPRLRDRRRDVLDLLGAEQAALAGVRIQARHGDARRVQAGAAQRGVGDAQGLQHPPRRDLVDRLAQGHMDGHQHHPQLVVGQHHAHRRQLPLRVGAERLQQLGVAGMVDAAGMQRFLVDGRRDQRARAAGLLLMHRRDDAARRRRARRRADAAQWLVDQVRGQARRLPDRQAIGRGEIVGPLEHRHRQVQAQDADGPPEDRDVTHQAQVRAAVAGPGGDGDLGPDAAGVAHRQQQRSRARGGSGRPVHAGLGMSMKR